MPISKIEFRVESTGQWVTVDQRDPADEDGLRIWGCGKHPSGYLEVLYENIPGSSWNPQRLAKFAERANQFLEYRIPLTDPSLVDDPAGPNGADPARPDFYWDSGDLVAKAMELSDVTYSAENGLNFTLTRLR
jgi:hypothetical protein